jgi:hypothetical protein
VRLPPSFLENELHPMLRPPSRVRSGPRGLIALLLTLLPAAGCATAGSTFGSGVGDALMEEPPYYAGELSYPAGRVAHVPIAYQRGASQAELFDPDARPNSPVTALLAEMNAYLDSLGVTTPLTAPVPGIAPDVYFGCDLAPMDECTHESSTQGRHGEPLLRLAVGRPSSEWTAALPAALAEVGADRVLVLTLEVGLYWPHQRNLRGDKEVHLGTDHAVRVPWLTALDEPVQVLQLTGALVAPTGRAERIGAEGLLAQRTNVVLVSMGVHELISDDDVEALRTAVRPDLPGAPLVWRAALRDLLAQLVVR